MSFLGKKHCFMFIPVKSLNSVSLSAIKNSYYNNPNNGNFSSHQNTTTEISVRTKIQCSILVRTAISVIRIIIKMFCIADRDTKQLLSSRL